MQQLYIADQYQWKPLIQEHHRKDIPIYQQNKDGTLTQILASHVPKDLYIQKQYKRLNDHILYYHREFQKNCHSSIEKDDFHFSALQSNLKQIRLGLQEISQELAFLNLRPFADVVKKLNNLLISNNSNFINFVKSTKRGRFTLFQNKSQLKNDFRNYCLDCKTHRQQIIIKQLKKKLNLAKIEQFSALQQENCGVGDQISRKIQAQVSKNYNKIKMSIKQTMQKEQKRQQIIKQKKYKNQYKLQTQTEDDILVMEKQNYIEQVNALLQGRQTNVSGNTQTYSYLMNELMNFPVQKFNSRPEEEILKQTEKLSQKIKKQLFDNFLVTLSEPIRQVFKRLIKKNDFNQIHGLDIQNKIVKCDAETQTSKDSQQKIQLLQKSIQKKNHQISTLKYTNQGLQKKYIEKYQQLRQQQKDSFTKHKQIKRCYRQIQGLNQKIQDLQNKLFNQNISKNNQLKQFQIIHQNQIKQLKKQENQRFNEYRYKMNCQTTKKIQLIKSQKSYQIQMLKSMGIREETFQMESNFEDELDNQLLQSIKMQNNKHNKQNKSALKKNQTVKAIVNKQVKLNQHMKTEEYFNVQMSNRSQSSIGSRVYSQKSSKSFKCFKSVQSQKKKKTQKQIKLLVSQDVQKQLLPLSEGPCLSKQKQQKNQQRSEVKINFSQNSQSQKSIDLMIKKNNSKIKEILNSKNEYNKSSLNNNNNNNSSSNSINSNMNTNANANANAKYALNNKKNIFKIVPKEYFSELDHSEELVKSFQGMKQNQFNYAKSQRFQRNTEKPQFSKKTMVLQAQSETCNVSPDRQNMKKIKKIPMTKIHQFQRGKQERMNTIQQVENNQNQLGNSCNQIQKSRKFIKSKRKIAQKSVKFEVLKQQKIQNNKQLMNQKSQNQNNDFLKYNRSSNSNIMKKQVLNLHFKKVLYKLHQNSNLLNEFASEQQYQNFKTRMLQKIQQEFNFLYQIGLFSFIQSINLTQTENLETVIKRKSELLTLENKKKTQQKQNQRQKQKQSSNSNNYQSKTLKTLKIILTQNASLTSNVGVIPLCVQKIKISNKLAQEFKLIETFSQIKKQDFQLFGQSQLGNLQAWQNLKVNEIGLDNKFNQDITKIQAYFNFLFTFDKLKYLQYTNLLLKPVESLKQKQNSNNNNNNNKNNIYKIYKAQDFCGKFKVEIVDKQKFRSNLYKIFKFHQVSHNSKCQHIEKLLKKIGYYRYSNFYGCKLALQSVK